MTVKQWLAILFLCLPLAACAPKVENPFAGDFACEVVFTLGETDYRAEYARRGEAETFTLSAPETLCGLTATRAGETVELTVGGTTFAPLAGDKLFDFTAVLRPRPLACTAYGDGYRLTGEDYTLVTDSTGLPLMLTSGRYRMRFIRFERGDTE